MLLLLAAARAQILPMLGTDSTLDIACWNMEWFGDASNGPANDGLQFSNAQKILYQTGIDVWAVEEMSNETYFSNLSSQLPDYGSVNSTFSWTQKMALFWNKNRFSLLSSQHILTDKNYDFASRPPLLAVLQTKADTGLFYTDTLYVIVVHLKANSESDFNGRLQSYNRRKNSAGWLKNYVETNLTGKKYLIIGDWNDDLNTSIFDNTYETPFKNLLDAGYTFVTKPLSDAGKKTHTLGRMIDHILVSQEMKSFYVENSAAVFDNPGAYILNYSSTTSDHYPVYAQFRNNKKPAGPGLMAGEINPDASSPINVFPNPASNLLHVEGVSNSYQSLKIVDWLGKEWMRMNADKLHVADISSLPAGSYLLVAEGENADRRFVRFVVQK